MFMLSLSKLNGKGIFEINISILYKLTKRRSTRQRKRIQRHSFRAKSTDVLDDTDQELSSKSVKRDINLRWGATEIHCEFNVMY